MDKSVNIMEVAYKWVERNLKPCVMDSSKIFGGELKV